MVFSSQNRWYGFDSVSDPAKQFYDLVILSFDCLLRMGQNSQRKEHYSGSRLDLCVAFLLMWAVLAATSRE